MVELLLDGDCLKSNWLCCLAHQTLYTSIWYVNNPCYDNLSMTLLQPPIEMMREFVQHTDAECTSVCGTAMNSWSEVFEGLVHRFALRKNEVVMHECIDKSGSSVKCFRVTVEEVELMLFLIDEAKHTQVYSSRDHHIYRIENDIHRKTRSNMVSLYSLLHFQPISSLKRHLARLYIDFPAFLSEQEHPTWELFISVRGNQSSLALHGSDRGVVSGEASLAVQSENAKLMYEILVSELESYPADMSNGR